MAGVTPSAKSGWFLGLNNMSVYIGYFGYGRPDCCLRLPITRTPFHLFWNAYVY
jgi:hypothetical protein